MLLYILLPNFWQKYEEPVKRSNEIFFNRMCFKNRTDAWNFPWSLKILALEGRICRLCGIIDRLRIAAFSFEISIRVLNISGSLKGVRFYRVKYFTPLLARVDV